MKKIFLSLSLLAAVLLQSVNAQMTVGTSAAPVAGSVLDLSQVSAKNLGLMIPQVNLSTISGTNKTNLEKEGMVVYNLADKAFYAYQNGVWVTFATLINGRIAYGTTTPNLNAGLHIMGDGSNDDIVFDGIADAPLIRMRRANGSKTTPANLTNGDLIGGINFGAQINGGMAEGIASIMANYRGTGTTNASSLSINSSTASVYLHENGNVGIGTSTPTTYKLQVAGTAGGTSWTNISDARYKTNIQTIQNPLQKVLQLQGKTYKFDTEKWKDKGFLAGTQYGVIAQEVEKIVPEVVTTDAEGYKGVNYDALVPLLIEAIKAQQAQIDELKKQINK